MPFHPQGLTTSSPSGKVNPTFQATGQGPILTRRIPRWPYADPKGGLTVSSVFRPGP
jgi:hypothetical protein